MGLLAQLASTAASVVALAAPLAAVLVASRALLDRLDDRGLFKVQPFPWLPPATAAALEWTLIRDSGLARALAPAGLWTHDAWAVDLAALHARHLSPQAAIASAAATLSALAADPLGHAAALTVATAATGAIAAVAALAWRSPAAWRGVFLHLWLTAAWWLALHHAAVLACWTLHWLNFWVFFVLLAFLQMRRKEGSGPKTYPS